MGGYMERCRPKGVLFFTIAVFIFVLQKGQGPPGREPVFNEEQRKQMMAHAYRKQEELKVSVNVKSLCKVCVLLGHVRLSCHKINPLRLPYTFRGVSRPSDVARPL